MIMLNYTIRLHYMLMCFIMMMYIHTSFRLNLKRSSKHALTDLLFLRKSQCSTIMESTSKNEFEFGEVIKRNNQESFLEKTFFKRKVLICGDGDFSFTLALSRCSNASMKYGSLISTTLANETELHNHYPEATSNIYNFLQNQSLSTHDVSYGIDATNLHTLGYSSFDVVLWNFPHVNGKQNIKHNRLLLSKFLRSARSILASSSSSTSSSLNEPSRSIIIVSLCKGQSGLEAKTILEWNRSWKLLLQAADAGLSVTNAYRFDESLYLDGYKPQGHRGYGGGFNISSSITYILSPLPALSSSPVSCMALTAIQSPIYVHEVHMHVDIQLSLSGDNFSQDIDVKKAELQRLEDRVRLACQKISQEHGFQDTQWCCDLVDVYIDPRTQSLTVAHQLGYCSLIHSLSRSQAVSFATTMEQELPRALNYKPRIEKHSGQVSQGYPFFVAQVLRSDTSLESYMEHMQSLYGDRNEELFDSNDDTCDDGNINFAYDNVTKIQSIHADSIVKAKILTGVMWRKRAGVIANSFK